MPDLWTPPPRKLSHRPDGLQHQWAEGRVTTLDMATTTGSDSGLSMLIDETAGVYPELTQVPARDIRGTDYKQLVRVGLPKVGFRNANEGSVTSKGRYEQRTATTHIFDPRWEADQMMADGHEDGAAAFIAAEAAGMLEASFGHLAKCFYYGRTIDPKGAIGLIDLYDRAVMEFDAKGTGNGRTSVYAVRLGPMDVQWCYGNAMGLSTTDVRVEQCHDDDGNKYDAYVQKLQGWIGLKSQNRFSVARLKNLTEQDGKTLTDDLLGQLVDLFPTGQGPDLLLMSKRSRRQLRESRRGDDGRYPGQVTEHDDIPIAVTDAISDDEDAKL